MHNIFKKLNSSKVFHKLSEKEFAWVLYDVGNSAFIMLACSLIPIWFKALSIGEGPGKLTSDEATAYYALSISAVTIVIAFLGPVLGNIADNKGMKKIFFTTVVSVGVICCIINGFTTSWLLFLLLYIVTRICYIGSCIPFLVALIAYVLGPDMVGIISASLSKQIGCIVTALWWAIVTLPLLKNYEQLFYTEKKEHAIRNSFKEIGHTLKTIALKDKKVLYFLIAFFFYIDGVGTIIDNCINIGTDLNLNTVGQVVFLLGTQVVAFFGSLFFAKLSKKYDTVQILLICIVGYFGISLYALCLKTLMHFAILAFGVGIFQGSIQSMSRSYYTKIIPAEHSGEYFGIYDIFSKGASFLGSLVIAAVKLLGGTINVAVACLAIFFALGFIFLKIANKQNSLN